MSGMTFFIQLVVILVCSMLGTGVPILQNKMICVISLNQEELSRGTFATLFCFARAGYWMDFDPLLICYVFYLGKKRRENKI